MALVALDLMLQASTSSLEQQPSVTTYLEVSAEQSLAERHGWRDGHTER